MSRYAPQKHAPSPGAAAGRAKPRYTYPRRLVLGIVTSALLGRKRAFSTDAAQLIARVAPQPRVENAHFIPHGAPFAVVTNHYYRPGYQVWWGVALITRAIAQARGPLDEVTWLMTNRWTYTDWLRDHLVTPLTHRLFTRLAQVYGFVSMPPMPPQPRYSEEGARGVRQALSLLRSAASGHRPMLGFAPEGRDSPDGSLIEPPPGTGRFLLHLHKHGLRMLPVAVAEIEGALTARFGPPFALRSEPTWTREERDRQACAQVMTSIGLQLPEALWGAFRSPIERARREQDLLGVSG